MEAFKTCSQAAEYFQLMRGMLEKVDSSKVDAYADLIFEAWKERRRVFVFGNGGSSYVSSHHTTDYVKTAAVQGYPKLQAFSLVDNTGLLTATANDIGYDETFRLPLEAYAAAGDLAVALSCSGNSPNVVNACQWAKNHGLKVVSITGFSGGKIGPLADIHIHIPCDNYGIVEDIQMSIGHIVTQSLQRRIQALQARS